MFSDSDMGLPKVFTLTNGTTVPAVGFGTFQGDGGNSKVKDAVMTALRLGYRHIDGANAYEKRLAKRSKSVTCLGKRYT